MVRKNFPILLIAVLCFAFSFCGPQSSYAKDSDMKPEELVAAHLKSIGSPEVLAGIKNRGIAGTAKVQFIQGGTGTMEGQALMVSAGPNLGFIMKFGGVDYPGEHFAYNGTEVTIADISPGQRSPLGEFLNRYNFILKEGLFGGVLSLGWPLLDIEQKNPSLKYDRSTFNDKEVHELRYIAKSGMNDVKVKLFFDLDTFHHIGTEYRLRVKGERALQSGKTVTEGVPSFSMEGGLNQGTVTRPAGVLDVLSDSIYVLVETFDNFREVQFKEGSETRSITLPHTYSIRYSNEGEGSTFLGIWSMEVSQCIQNGTINASFFKAR